MGDGQSQEFWTLGVPKGVRGTTISRIYDPYDQILTRRKPTGHPAMTTMPTFAPMFASPGAQALCVRLECDLVGKVHPQPLRAGEAPEGNRSHRGVKAIGSSSLPPTS